MIALAIGCAIACGGLVVAEWRGLRGLRAAAKPAASAAFVGVGLLALATGDHGAAAAGYGHAIFAGLVLGAIGDVCLLRRDRAWFLAGLVAFLLGHLAYVAAIARLAPAGDWLVQAGWPAAAPVAAGGAVLWALWPRLGSLRVAVVAYVAAITVMVIAAIAAARGHALPAPRRCQLVVGACLFFVSDVAVARDRFVAHRLANKLWGLPAYYAAQLLIAGSLAGS